MNCERGETPNNGYDRVLSKETDGTQYHVIGNVSVCVCGRSKWKKKKSLRKKHNLKIEIEERKLRANCQIISFDKLNSVVYRFVFVFIFRLFRLTIFILIIESHWTDRTNNPSRKRTFPVEQNSTCWKTEKYDIVKDCQPCTGKNKKKMKENLILTGKSIYRSFSCLVEGYQSSSYFQKFLVTFWKFWWHY